MARKFSKYYTRVDFRRFLNGPGHHAGAAIHAYIEDTTPRSRRMEKETDRYYRGDKDTDFRNPSPKIILEISDCSNKTLLELDLGSDTTNCNTFHKIDTLIEGLTDLREGLDQEMRMYRARRKFMESDAKHNRRKRRVRERREEEKRIIRARKRREEERAAEAAEANTESETRSVGDKVMDQKRIRFTQL